MFSFYINNFLLCEIMQINPKCLLKLYNYIILTITIIIEYKLWIMFIIINYNELKYIFVITKNNNNICFINQYSNNFLNLLNTKIYISLFCSTQHKYQNFKISLQKDHMEKHIYLYMYAIMLSGIN